MQVHENYGGVNGLTYIQNFISLPEEKKILKHLDLKGSWVAAFGSRQTQQYGFLYDFFTEELTPTEPIPKAPFLTLSTDFWRYCGELQEEWNRKE